FHDIRCTSASAPGESVGGRLVASHAFAAFLMQTCFTPCASADAVSDDAARTTRDVREKRASQPPGPANRSRPRRSERGKRTCVRSRMYRQTCRFLDTTRSDQTDCRGVRRDEDWRSTPGREPACALVRIGTPLGSRAGELKDGER